MEAELEVETRAERLREMLDERPERLPVPARIERVGKWYRVVGEGGRLYGRHLEVAEAERQRNTINLRLRRRGRL